MIVDPDFLDHWRTGMVADALADPMAPLYILRLWSHCQERKSDSFVMPPRGLKAQCKYAGDADAFEAALVEAGFIERQGDSIHVCGWAEKNASLLAAWENGSKGGRPPKKPKANPAETHGLPRGNPAETQTEPSANQTETQTKPIREEKRREEESPSLRSGDGARATRLPADWVLPDDWADWAKAERPDLDLLTTAAGFADYWRAKPGKDGRKLDWLMTWRNWVRNERQHSQNARASPPAETAYQRSMRERVQEAAPSIARQAPQDATDFFRTVDVPARVVGTARIT